MWVWAQILGHCTALIAVALDMCVQVRSTTTLGVEDLYIVTSVTLENVWDNTLFDVQYQRTLDPNQEEVRLPLGCAHFDLMSCRLVY